MRSGLRWYRLLALIPAAALLGAPWIADVIEPKLGGMPFLLAWIVVWVLLSSVVMGIIGWLDARVEQPD
jgi:hypothetical protein